MRPSPAIEHRRPPQPDDPVFPCPLCSAPIDGAALLADLEGLELLACAACGAVLAA